MKRCSTCKVEKDTSLYYKDSRAKDKLQTRCKDCHNEANQRWKDNNKESYQQVKRKAHVKSKYGVSLEWIDEQLEMNNHECPLCNTKIIKGKNLAVDHCHDTGDARAVICRTCNSAMGHLKDSPELLEKAMEYLKKSGTMGIRND